MIAFLGTSCFIAFIVSVVLLVKNNKIKKQFIRSGMFANLPALKKKSKQLLISTFSFLTATLVLVAIDTPASASTSGSVSLPIQSSVSSTVHHTDTLYDVVRVVDGDTIVINYEGKEEKVRFLLIDTPESVHSDEERNVPYGEISSQFTKDLLEGQQVSLEFDVQERDQYGRLLAYVYLGDKMVNETLLENGHAVVSVYQPNVKYVDEFRELEKQAKENKVGLWEDEEHAESSIAQPPVEQEPIVQQQQPAAQEQPAQEEPAQEQPAPEQAPAAQEPVGYGYIANANTGKFHYAGCSSVNQMNESNKVGFSSREDAVNAGYVPCKRCNP